MTPPAEPLPAEVLDALQRGDAVGAIKILRHSRGLGLKEAKDLIDGHLQGRPMGAAVAGAVGPLPPQVREALHRGDKIEAIKLLREHSSLGLKEAKDAVDAYARESGSAGAKLAPGEVGKSGNATAWVLAVLVIAIAAYYFLRAPA